MKIVTHKQWIGITLLSISLLSIGTIGLNYVIDPLRFYHHPWVGQPAFSKEQRFQLPALAKHYAYDSIILGSSVTENFKPSMLKASLGWEAMKLSISGATIREEKMIGSLALQTGQVDHVLWGIDYFSLRGDPMAVREDQGAFPFYLYDHNVWNDFRYLFNVDTARDTASVLWDVVSGASDPIQDLDTMYTWEHSEMFGKDQVLAKWHEASKSPAKPDQELEMNHIKGNIDRNIVAMIAAHPEVEFTLFYPPYSILLHKLYYTVDPQLLENEALAKRYLYEQTEGLDNVVIHDFQTIQDITFELDHYKDLAHYSMEINKRIVDYIEQGSYIVDELTLEMYNDTLREQVIHLDVDSL